MLHSGLMDDHDIELIDRDAAGEFPFDPTLYVFHLSVAVNRLRDNQLERELKAAGVSLAQHRALTVISRFGPCTMTELADNSAVDRTTLTRTVDQLVREGHVVRSGQPGDRRQVVLSLTPSGRGAAALARDVVGRHNRRILTGVPNDELRAMVRAQRTILANLEPGPERLDHLLTLARSDPPKR
ncbi:MarR family winged helix-turn-helix transcriptional regulator [Caulobacter sp. KR2-114]|uniref:MarR family winged helix-turn-helix transcriptional regulator n=1 Tax=Caulobacter sp. KR2-114 TaxID=3400912 RepID=UPI003C09B9E9